MIFTSQYFLAIMLYTNKCINIQSRKMKHLQLKYNFTFYRLI